MILRSQYVQVSGAEQNEGRQIIAMYEVGSGYSPRCN